MATDQDKSEILIFEDNQTLKSLLETFFRKTGYRVTAAEDAMDSVELARRHEPRLIVMDMLMPGKDGVRACTELREAGVTAPIVMLTSKALPEDRDRALAAGASEYLLKPLDTVRLRAMLERHLEPKRA